MMKFLKYHTKKQVLTKAGKINSFTKMNNMKSNLLILTVLAIFMGSFTAQAQQVRFSPKVGMNFSGLEKELMDFNTEARVGYNVGFDLRIGEGLFQLHPGAHYHNFTADLISRDNIDEERPDLKERTTIQQLKVPLNIGLNLTGDGGVIGIYAKGGLTPSILLGVKERADFQLTNDDLNTFVFGTNFGAGVDILNLINVDFNYEIGMSNLFSDQDSKNNVFTVSVGLVF